MKPQVCLYCDKVLSPSKNHADLLRDGDMVMCAFCSGHMVLVDNGKFRVPTHDEYRDIAKSLEDHTYDPEAEILKRRVD